MSFSKGNSDMNIIVEVITRGKSRYICLETLMYKYMTFSSNCRKQHFFSYSDTMLQFQNRTLHVNNAKAFVPQE